MQSRVRECSWVSWKVRIVCTGWILGGRESLKEWKKLTTATAQPTSPTWPFTSWRNGRVAKCELRSWVRKAHTRISASPLDTNISPYLYHPVYHHLDFILKIHGNSLMMEHHYCWDEKNAEDVAQNDVSILIYKSCMFPYITMNKVRSKFVHLYIMSKIPGPKSALRWRGFPEPR